MLQPPLPKSMCLGNKTISQFSLQKLIFVLGKQNNLTIFTAKVNFNISDPGILTGTDTKASCGNFNKTTDVELDKKLRKKQPNMPNASLSL